MAEPVPFLEPLKTLHETRSEEVFVRAFVIEIPANIVKPIIPNGGKHPSFSHFRRVCTLSHLPEDLTWRRDYDSRGLQTSFLLVPNTVVPWENIRDTFLPHIDVEGLPRCFDAVVPRFGPLNAEQAALWTERYWPTIYNPAAQVIQDAPPLHHLKRVKSQLEVPAADKYMGLAMMAAMEAREMGHGRAVGAVIVDPETDAVLAVAGDARWYAENPKVQRARKSNGAEGRPEYHAVMRAIAMVANKELRRRIAAGGHKKFLTTYCETPSGQALTSIEARYEDDGKALQDLTTQVGNIAISEPHDALPEKQSGPQKEGYLCSGLDIYVTHEPCVCCGMGMIHSRFRSCVLGREMPGSGGLSAEKGANRLGYGLFWRRELNWRVMTFQHTGAAALDGEGRIETGIFHA
ncbi:tRNA-specific adenosine deaminase subunit tad3 [Exophiala xenobiotica]|nr:tRNA-specific adenosine deaminase subunit tad3 [Exophiala xenobiotica]KAK5382345.1 tRNA-specific adenosine deaminase subunit tad3 [Exophiala xenobiotica]KAK5396004.1 tRNA-specific adenosine deaminase subunit tad3 [Exophiala xenobiotica]KAK5423957.1 tRNA-specific adenosine deaminase subunit tad3 [Exophiala xenobiotica]KAK5490436.1 tRNA-specific adenosine deaminase subunit tad3 [Exophiala xenobiotica]